MNNAPRLRYFFFFNVTPTTEIYTLSLHDALPISNSSLCWKELVSSIRFVVQYIRLLPRMSARMRSEEHTSELQSLTNLLSVLRLEKKKRNDAAAVGGRHEVG